MSSQGVVASSRRNEGLETYLNLNVKLLSCMGININLSKNEIVKRRRFFEKTPALLAIALQVYCAFSQVLSIAEAMQNHQYMLAIEIGSHLFSNTMISSKGCRLIIVVTKVDSLLQELAYCWRTYVPGHKIRGKILKKADNARLICKIFILFTIGGIVMYGLPVLINLSSIYVHQNAANYTRDYKRIFFMKYPFEITNLMTYIIVIIIEEYLLLGTALFWMCGDTLFAQLTTHASLQFEILRSDIESLMNMKLAGLDFTRNFSILIERHKHLLKICNKIEKVYSFIILMTMVLSGLNICFNIFIMIETINDGDYKEAALHGILVVDTLGGMVFYCVFAETLTTETSAIGDAIYNSNWTDKDYKLSIYVQMLIIKSQSPFQCTAYGYFPIGHTRLTTILNTALSYFMMLRATT